jgi:hypothetical protein
MQRVLESLDRRGDTVNARKINIGNHQDAHDLTQFTKNMRDKVSENLRIGKYAEDGVVPDADHLAIRSSIRFYTEIGYV